MAESVDAKFTLVCGKRGGGKTGRTIRQLFKAVAKGRKVLIFDVRNEFGDYMLTKTPEQRISIKPMDIIFVPRFSVSHYPEIRRIVPFMPDGTPFGTDMLLGNLSEVLTNFRNGILLTEDLSAIVTDAIPGDLYGRLATLRQAGVDVIAHFQMIGKAAHPKMIAMANYIRLHKTEDSVDRHREKFGDKVPMMLIAEKIVEARYRYGMAKDINDETGKYFNVTIDVDYSKIRGIFTRAEAEKAIEAYISEEKVAKKIQGNLDKKGNKIYHSYEEAYAYVEQKLMDDFFIWDQ